MCGRFARYSELDSFVDLVDDFEFADVDSSPPSYNITPSQKSIIVALNAEGQRKPALLEWGLVPGWVSKTGLQRPINARSESMFEKPMFKRAASKRRCLILCDGFYEWGKTENGKQPYYFHRSDSRPFIMGGLWESNRRLNEHSIYSFCVVTKQAPKTLSSVHHRMPLILDAEGINQWLDAEAQKNHIEECIEGVDGAGISYYAVSSFVNNPGNNTPQCFEPIH